MSTDSKYKGLSDYEWNTTQTQEQKNQQRRRKLIMNIIKEKLAKKLERERQKEDAERMEKMIAQQEKEEAAAAERKERQDRQRELKREKQRARREAKQAQQAEESAVGTGVENVLKKEEQREQREKKKDKKRSQRDAAKSGQQSEGIDDLDAEIERVLAEARDNITEPQTPATIDSNVAEESKTEPATSEISEPKRKNKNRNQKQKQLHHSEETAHLPKYRPKQKQPAPEDGLQTPPATPTDVPTPPSPKSVRKVSFNPV